jgi:hypothetical protein
MRGVTKLVLDMSVASTDVSIRWIVRHSREKEIGQWQES